jgi:hypothetical protein
MVDGKEEEIARIKSDGLINLLIPHLLAIYPEIWVDGKHIKQTGA